MSGILGRVGMGRGSGFEQVHGLMDRVMLMLKTAFGTKEEGVGGGDEGGDEGG